MRMLQWIADIGADAEWGKGSCAKEGTIPPTKLRRSGIADPATQIWGGGRSHSPKQDPEGGGGKESEKFKKQSLKGPCEPKSGRKWLFGRRIMDSSRRCTILGMIWHPCLKSPLKSSINFFFKLFRYAKMTEWMDNVEMAIAKVLWICFYCSVMIQGNYCWKMNNYKAFLSNQF